MCLGILQGDNELAEMSAFGKVHHCFLQLGDVEGGDMIDGLDDPLTIEVTKLGHKACHESWLLYIHQAKIERRERGIALEDFEAKFAVL